MKETRNAPGSQSLFALIVDPDISSDSLCRKIAYWSLDLLKAQFPEYTVTVTDLQKDGWNEVLSIKDFTKISDPIHINFRMEQEISPLIQKIKDEQTKLLKCDFFMVFGPLSWFGLPSHFYAWWERVVTHGKLYKSGAIFNRGLLFGKKAMLVVTSKNSQEKFGRDGINGFVEELLYPITHGMFHMIGFQVRRTQCLFAPTQEKLDEIYSKWPAALRMLNDRMLISFNKPDDYLNWKLVATESDRKNDFEVLSKSGDMSLQETTM